MCASRKFTEEELKNIIKDYKSGMKPKQLGEKYNRRNCTIIYKLKSIGVYKNEKHWFTKDDVEFLKEYYPIGDWDAISKRFPSLPKMAITAKASSLGLKIVYWSDEDLEYLKNNYMLKTVHELCEDMNFRHTESAIKTMASRKFGLCKCVRWTEKEDCLLRDNYNLFPMEYIIGLFQNRSYNSIIHRAGELGLKAYYELNTYYNAEQEKFIIDNWKTMSDSEMGECLGKNVHSIMDKRHSMGLYRQDRQHRKYTDLNKYIRGQIWNWKAKSIENCDYKCVFTGSKDFEIHHMYSVSHIIRDIFDKNKDIEFKDFKDYSKEELDHIVELFLTEQEKHGLGVCVRKDIHTLYHNLYGKADNNKAQWDKFCKNFRNGKYNDIITI